MWNELETLVKTHAGATDRHQRVLDCIIACRSKPPEEEERKKRGRKREDREDRTEKNGNKDTEEKSWQESERYSCPDNLNYIVELLIFNTLLFFLTTDLRVCWTKMSRSLR